jgi:hypothetical protein
VDGRDDEVELGEAVVGQVHRAVGQDVALDAGEQRDAFEALADLADMRRVLERRRFVEAAGHRQRLAVIGDGDVLQARAFAASAIVSMSLRPSVLVVWRCRSPLRSARVISAGSALRSAASISPRYSRSSGGTSARPSAV